MLSLVKSVGSVRAMQALAAVVLVGASPAFGQYKIAAPDRDALVALLGETKVSDLKLDKLSGAGHTLTVLRSPMGANGEASGGKDTLVADENSFFFCNAYIDIMSQVILDDKAALLHVVHRNPSDRVKPSRSGMHYDWTHIVRAFKGQTIVTADERAAAKESGIISFQEAKVTQFEIEKAGFKKHRQLLTNCEKAAGRLKEMPESRGRTESYEQRRFKALMERMTSLESGGGGTKSAPAGTMR